MLRLRNWIAGAWRSTAGVFASVVTGQLPGAGANIGWSSDCVAVFEHGFGSKPPPGSWPVTGSAVGSHGDALSGIRPICVVLRFGSRTHLSPCCVIGWTYPDRLPMTANT